MTRLLATLRHLRRRRAYGLVAEDIIKQGPGHCYLVPSSFWSTQTPQGRAINASSALLLLEAVKQQAGRS